MRRVPLVIVCAACLQLSSMVGAQTWPSKPIRLVVPQSPGGATDFTARLLAQRLTAALKQQVIVENRPGAAGNIGTDLVAKATPDGYTALFASVASIGIAPHVYKNLPYNPAKDFAPVTVVANLHIVLVVIPSIPAKTVAEFIEVAKKTKLTYGSPGRGEPSHLAGQLFETMTGTSLLHVPYKGGGQAIIGLLGGEVHALFAGASTVIPHIRSGRLRALGVTGNKRFELLPDVPTIAETLPGYVIHNWLGVFFPAAAPREVVDRLNAEVIKVLQTPDVRSELLAAGLETTWLTPAEFTNYVRAETAKWSKVVRDAGITPE